MIFYDTQCSFVKHSSYSQDPKALAEDQRGWHQKFTQLVKQPLSKGFLSAFQASQMYQIISAHSLSYQKRQYFDMFDLYVYIKTYQNIISSKIKTLGQFGCSDLSAENPYFFPRLLVRSYTKASRSKSSLYLALLCNLKIRVAE